MLDVRILEPPASDGFPWKEAIEIAPQLIWAAIVVAVLLMIGPSRIRAALSRASKISFGGLEIELAAQVDQAAVNQGTSVAPIDRDRVVRRLERSKSLVSCARFLWIDDNPKNNSAEFDILRQLGANIDLATTDQDARTQLARGVYDVILSDMTRGDDPEAGKKLLPAIGDAPLNPPVIFYVGNLATVAPLGAFGITTKPDELCHLILDALERRKG